MDNSDTRVILGRLSTVFGVKGWLKVNSHTQQRENIFDYPQWQLKIGNQWQNWRVVEGRPHGKTLIVKLDGCDDPEQAQKLVGSEFAVNRSELPETEEDEHYWSDIIGMQVITVAGKDLGIVKEILETGSNDVLIVTNNAADKKTECLVPWLDGNVIIDVNKDSSTITVDWDADF